MTGPAINSSPLISLLTSVFVLCGQTTQQGIMKPDLVQLWFLIKERLGHSRADLLSASLTLHLMHQTYISR